jgi:hypothetical protein
MRRIENAGNLLEPKATNGYFARMILEQHPEMIADFILTR